MIIQLYAPVTAKLTEYKGYWADTSCCPLATGFKLKYANGDKIEIGVTTPESEDSAFHNTGWISAPGSLVGF